MTALTVGQRLRERREERHLSLEEASQATRIRTHYLAALEQGNFSALPSMVQGRGFLRAYARHLDLDGDALLAEVDRPAGEITERSAQPEAEQVLLAREDTLSTESPSEPPQTIEPAEQEPTQPPGPEAKEQRGYKGQRESVNAPSPGRVFATRQRTPAPAEVTHEVRAIFLDIGSRLRQQRELLGLSLEDVERHTHLRIHNLRALEQGRIEDLPSPVQARGMLGNYASFLGMDADILLLRFADGLQAGLSQRQLAARQEQGGRTSAAATRQRESLFGFRRLFSPDLIIGGLLVIFLAIFLGWGALRISNVRASQTATATAPSIADVLAPETAAPTSSETTPLPTGGTQTPTEPGDLPDNGTPNAQGQPADTEPSPSPTLFAVSSGNAIEVNLVARMRSWVRITVDGEIGFEGRVTPGTAYSFSANDRIEVLTGNGAALQVFFNGRDLGAIGVLGQVINRIFTAEGMQTPTPTATPIGLPPPASTPTLPSGLVFPTPGAP